MTSIHRSKLITDYFNDVSTAQDDQSFKEPLTSTGQPAPHIPGTNLSTTAAHSLVHIQPKQQEGSKAANTVGIAKNKVTNRTHKHAFTNSPTYL